MLSIERAGNNPLVIIEGVDYSGKSTLSGEVASALGGIAIRPIPPELGGARDLIEQFCSKDERYSFFIASSLLTYERIKGVFIKKSPVVVDRWMFSTNKHHQLLGVSSDLILPTSSIPRSEFMFFTSTSYDSWRKRKESRNLIGVDDDLITEDFMLELNQFLRSEGLVEINTDKMSVEESTKYVLDHIQRQQQDFLGGTMFVS